MVWAINKVGIPTLLRSVRKWRYNGLAFFSEIYDLYMHEAGVTWIQSQVTHDQAQLDAWARSTVAVETSNRSAEDICHAVEKLRRVESPVEAKSYYFRGCPRRFNGECPG